MHKYEITFLVESEKQAKEVASLISSTGASYTQTKEWGQRDLAYPIGKHTKAYYFTGTIETIPTNVTEIKKKLNFSELLIRFLLIKQEA